MKKVHQKCSVFRRKMYAKLWCHHLLICSQLTIWRFGWWRAAAFWAWSVTEVQERKLVLLELFWLFNLGAFSMRALKGEFWLIQLQLLKASQLLAIYLALILAVKEGNICLALNWLVLPGGLMQTIFTSALRWCMGQWNEIWMHVPFCYR